MKFIYITGFLQSLPMWVLSVSLKYYVIEPITGLDPNSFGSSMVVVGLCYLSFFIYKKLVSKPVEILAQPNENIELNEFIKNTSEFQYETNKVSLDIEQNDTRNPLI